VVTRFHHSTPDEKRRSGRPARSASNERSVRPRRTAHPPFPYQHPVPPLGLQSCISFDSATARVYIAGSHQLETILGETFDLSGLVDEFRDEARAQLDRLDAALLKLEREGRIEEGERTALLRGLHTLKGNSGMLGFVALRDYVHAVESVVREELSEWPEGALDRLFEGASAIRHAVERAGTETEAAAMSRLAALPRPDTPIPRPFERSPAADEASPPAQSARPDEAEVEESAEILRVPFAKLDNLLNRVTELFGVQESMADLIHRERSRLEEIGMRRPLLRGVEQLEALISEVRDAAMDLRLVPVRRVFSRFPSLVRDLAREQGKQVRVEFEGEETELDKSTVDVLGGPLLHLVRNAVDHGIQPPEEREAAGQPPEGTITLRAVQSGDRVRIEVEDDGVGLNRDRIVARARGTGIIGPADEPTAAEVADLILRSGFSTREMADTVSGRGIGLDVVARTAARLRGRLEVQEAETNGTRFVLHLPLTLAVVPALLFEADGETLAIPALDVENAIRPIVQPRLAGADVIPYGDELIPLARPANLLGWSRTGPRGTASAEPMPRYAVVIRRGVRAAAIAADRLLEQRNVVVRALPGYLGQPRGVSGASIAPDGRVMLVLDAGGLIDLNLELHRRDERVAYR
jgi:two-component system, chemotaxis family, sensor kinase CheA